MSALPPKADILGLVAKSLLLTQSGHSIKYENQQVETENQWFPYPTIRVLIDPRSSVKPLPDSEIGFNTSFSHNIEFV